MTVAKAIRKALKEELGLNARKVGVRTGYGGYSKSIYVTVKVPVPIKPVAEIAERQEKIWRCDYTGDILAGGNTFVFVNYAKGVLEELYDAKAIREMKPGDELCEDGVILARMEDLSFVIVTPDDPTTRKTLNRFANPGACWVRERLGATEPRFL